VHTSTAAVQVVVLKSSSVQSPASQVLLSTWVPTPQVTLQGPITQSLYLSQACVLQSTFLINGSLQSPDRHSLVSTLVPPPHAEQQVPITHSL